MVKKYVFIGPSCPAGARKEHTSISFLGPAQRGSILALLHQSPTAIAVVDGFFGDRPSILHKEILAAIAQGVRVFGAASMGALRAAELSPFGMRGIGRVFRRYRDGAITSDDEVAILHAPAEFAYLPFTFALVNLRATVENLLLRRLIDTSLAHAIVAAAERLPYQERTIESLGKRLHSVKSRTGRVDRIIALLEHEWVDEKVSDARLLLRLIERIPDANAPIATSADADETTWMTWHALSYGSSGVCGVSNGDLLAVAKLLLSDYQHLHMDLLRDYWRFCNAFPNNSQASKLPSYGDPVPCDYASRGVTLADYRNWQSIRGTKIHSFQRNTPKDLLSWRNPLFCMPSGYFATGLKMSELYEACVRIATRVRDANRLQATLHFGFCHEALRASYLLSLFQEDTRMSVREVEDYATTRGFWTMEEFTLSLRLTHAFSRSNGGWRRLS